MLDYSKVNFRSKFKIPRLEIIVPAHHYLSPARRAETLGTNYLIKSKLSTKDVKPAHLNDDPRSRVNQEKKTLNHVFPSEMIRLVKISRCRRLEALA